MDLFKPARKLFPILVGYEILENYGFDAPNVYQKQFCRFTSLLGCFVLTTGLIFVGGFIAFQANTFQEYADNFYGFATLLNDTFYFLYMPWFCTDVLEMSEYLEDIIMERLKFPKKIGIYNKTRKIVELSSKYVHMVYLKILYPFITIPCLFMSYFKYFATDLGKDAFTLPFLLWDIIEWRTPTTYIFAFIFELIGGAYIVMVAATLLIYGIGSILLSIAFLNDIRADLIALNEYNKYKKTETELYDHLCKFIQFHSEIKQLLTKLGDIYDVVFTSNLLWTLTTMTVSLVSLQIELIQLNINLAIILKLICQTFASIIPFVVICNVTEHLHSRFDEIDIIERCDWYTFPIKIRQIFPIIIQNSQKMDFLNVFGNITVSRETCKLVVRRGFSTFIILRRFLK